MVSFRAARRLTGAVDDIDWSTAKEALDAAGRVGAKKGDEYVMEVLQQPERAARAKAQGVASAGKAVGAGAVTGGGAAGIGLYSYGQSNKAAAFRQAELDEQKLEVFGQVLNDPNTNAQDKAAIMESLAMAGVFENPEQAQGLFGGFNLGGSGGGGGGGGGLLSGSLSPMAAFGGGLSGLIITLVVMWAIVQMWEAYQKGGGSGGGTPSGGAPDGDWVPYAG